MFLEVITEDSEPKTYPLKNRVLIGASDSCDVVLPIHGVSRKHVLVLLESNEIYVVDQGSTNGTYIDEERLRPGLRVKVHVDLPIRISGNVLLKFIGSAEGPLQSLSTSVTNRLSQDSTTAFSLKDLESAEKKLTQKRKMLRKRSEKTALKRRTLSIVDVLNFIIAALFCFLLFLHFR